ncbi:MAG: type II toxin-antitoxin system PemK/MazF family toxin [Sulfobacillus sp.]
MPFPFDDLSSGKMCPAVCLTEAIGSHQHVVLAFVTSTIPAPLLASDLVLEEGSNTFAATGLRVTSTLRLHRLVTVTTTLLQRDLGSLSTESLIAVSDRLRTLFAL